MKGKRKKIEKQVEKTRKTQSSRAVQKCTKCCDFPFSLPPTLTLSLSLLPPSRHCSAAASVPERQLELQQTDLWHMLMSPVRRTLCLTDCLLHCLSVSLPPSALLLLQLVWKIIPRGGWEREESKPTARAF